MEYLGLKPIEGVNGKEPTAFTLKSIKELLADEAAKGSEQAKAAAKMLEAKPDPAPAPAPKSALQQPPHMTRAAAAPAPTPTAPPAPAPETQPAPQPEKPRSFFKRLIGG